MEPPSALYLECPTCGRTPHRVIRGRISKRKEIVLEGVFRCLRCGFTRQETYREWLALEVPMIVSDRETSFQTTLELNPGEIVAVGNRFESEGRVIEVTGIEARGARVPEAVAEDVETLWSKRVDRVQVKFSLNKGGKTLTSSLDVPPDEEFEVGMVVELGRDTGVIHRMKTNKGVLKHGAARAEELRRVYCRAMRKRRSGPRRRRPGR